MPCVPYAWHPLNRVLICSLYSLFPNKNLCPFWSLNLVYIYHVLTKEVNFTRIGCWPCFPSFSTWSVLLTKVSSTIASFKNFVSTTIVSTYYSCSFSSSSVHSIILSPSFDWSLLLNIICCFSSHILTVCFSCLKSEGTPFIANFTPKYLIPFFTSPNCIVGFE
jgi:hypothetical protein